MLNLKLPLTMDNNKKTAKGFFIFFSEATFIERLSNEEKGQLLDALFDYGQYGTIPHFVDRYLTFVFDTFKKKIDSYYKKQGLSVPEPTVDVEELDPDLALSKEEFLEGVYTQKPVTPEPLKLCYGKTGT